jgi:glycerol-3-phosphate acyltransferase PlsY
MPIAVAIFVGKTDPAFSLLLVFSISMAALAIWRHRSNIVRLLNGTENRFGKK